MKLNDVDSFTKEVSVDLRPEEAAEYKVDTKCLMNYFNNQRTTYSVNELKVVTRDPRGVNIQQTIYDNVIGRTFYWDETLLGKVDPDYLLKDYWAR